MSARSLGSHWRSRKNAITSCVLTGCLVRRNSSSAVSAKTSYLLRKIANVTSHRFRRSFGLGFGVGVFISFSYRIPARALRPFGRNNAAHDAVHRAMRSQASPLGKRQPPRTRRGQRQENAHWRPAAKLGRTIKSVAYRRSKLQRHSLTLFGVSTRRLINTANITVGEVFTGLKWRRYFESF